jgi:hypothetical protein
VRGGALVEVVAGRVVSDDFWEMVGFVVLGCLLIVLTVPLVLELLS